jgi:hypothetical protein
LTSQVLELYFQCHRQRSDREERGRRAAPGFDRADRVKGNVCLMGERLLRRRSALPRGLEKPGEGFAATSVSDAGA